MRIAVKRGWIVAAGLIGAISIGVIVGRYAIPSDRPRPSASPTLAAIPIPEPRTAPAPTPIMTASPTPEPRATPRPAPRRVRAPAVQVRAAPSDPDAVTVTITNSW